MAFQKNNGSNLFNYQAIGVEVRTRGPFWVPINRIFHSKIKFSRRFFDLFGHLDRVFDAESRAEHDGNNRF